jgi:hypothetical protein
MSLAQEIGAAAWEPVLELTADALAQGAGHDRPGARAAAARERLVQLGGEPVLPVPGRAAAREHEHQRRESTDQRRLVS